MRLMVSLLVGFVVGYLLVGMGLEWVIDEAAGTCSEDCAAWREITQIGVSVAAWALAARGFFLLWEELIPRKARSAREENIRRIKRGGW